ncbi:MAG: CaiB/BaiF CoA transferase family protein, partial [Caulobacteraceae bacterium]
MGDGALAGLRVLELGEFEAAAYCGKLFADLGADVIKVEPLGGVQARRLAPLVDAGEGRLESAHFAWLNTNKRSVVFGDDRDARLETLALACDVLIDGRAGDAALAWRDKIAKRRPALTMVELSWFGQSGPYRDFAATDATVRCLAGLVWPTGAPNEPPEPIADHQASVVGALNAFTAALAARFSQAPGRRFEVSLMEANLSISEFYSVAAAGAGFVERRYGRNRFPPTFPMGVYACKEGWLGVTVVTLDQWRGFCELFDLKEVAADPDFATAVGRFARADELERLYAPRLKEKTASEWFELALKMRLPFAVAPDMAELRRQETHRRRGAFAPVTIGAAEFDAPVLPQALRSPGPPLNGAAPLAGADAPTWADRSEVKTASSPGPRRRPLADVRIVDLTMGWAGPLATRQLADLGANVIKVESCGYPDWWRGADPRPEAVRTRQFEKSAIFNAVNRNKKGITLDLTQPEGAQLLERLVATADAVIENYSQGVLPRLGLDYARLSVVNPSLVMVSMPAFGSETEWRDARAYGSTLKHASGLPLVTGAPHDPPTMNHLALGDPIGGLNAAAALLAALFYKRRRGKGQHVELSQVECLFPLVAPWAIEQALSGEATRTGGRHPRFAPHGCFPCAGDDEWILVAAT